MAFQTGTRVDPRLMQADYSGFARAAQINAQAMANLGEQIGKAVTKYAVNKQKGEDKKLRYESILPYTTSMFGADEGEKMAQTFSNDPKLAAQIFEFAGMQKDQAALQRAFSVSQMAGGGTDYDSVLPSFIHFGGRDVGKAAEFVSQARESEQSQLDGGLTEAEREINRVMAANPNLSYTDAVNIKEGVSKIVTDPVTGRSAIVNLATGEEKPLARSEVTDAAVSASLAPEPGASESSLNLYKIAETTTGIVPAIQAAAQRLTGQVGIDVADPELLENIQTFNTAQSDIRRSMRTAPKFLASEMAMLDKELDIAPSAFKDPTTLLAQLRSIDKSIRNRLEGIQKSIKDPTLPADEVSAALRLQKDLINFLRNLNVPQVEQVDTQELYRLAGGTGDASGAPDISSIANKYLDQ